MDHDGQQRRPVGAMREAIRKVAARHLDLSIRHQKARRVDAFEGMALGAADEAHLVLCLPPRRQELEPQLVAVANQAQDRVRKNPALPGS